MTLTDIALTVLCVTLALCWGVSARTGRRGRRTARLTVAALTAGLRAAEERANGTCDALVQCRADNRRLRDQLANVLRTDATVIPLRKDSR